MNLCCCKSSEKVASDKFPVDLMEKILRGPYTTSFAGSKSYILMLSLVCFFRLKHVHIKLKSL